MVKVFWFYTRFVVPFFTQFHEVWCSPYVEPPSRFDLIHMLFGGVFPCRLEALFAPRSARLC
jgi:hypothetical protein